MYGITPDGFVVKPLQVIKSELETTFQNTFGNDLDVSAESVAGQQIGLMAKEFANIWEGMQAVYNAFDPNGNEGVALDRVAALINVNRLPPTFTQVTGVLIGDEATVIPSGSQASLNVTDDVFSLASDVTLALDNLLYAEIEVLSVIDSTNYTITINGTDRTVNSGTGSTIESIMAGLKVLVDAGGDPVVFTDNLDGTATLISDDNTTVFELAVTAVIMDTNLIGNPGTFISDVEGAIACPENTLANIVTPVAGWDSVDNYNPGTTGNEEETDEELRTRRAEIDNISCGGVEEAIRNRLLQEVVNITDVIIVSNRTNGTVDSIPAKAFEVSAEGGTDEDIAEVIWESMPAGIETYGNTTITVKDSTDRDQDIKFTRPVTQYLHARITIELYSEELFPSNGSDQIKEAVKEWADLEYTIGKDVLYQRLAVPVWTIPGLSTVAIQVDTTANPGDSPSYSAANISISNRQKVSASKDRMEVIII